MLPVLIKVFAGFSKVDGVIEESEIDSSLSALRHEFPETIYSDLRRLYREAIEESVDLNAVAKDLAASKNVMELVEKQTDFAKVAFDGYVKQMTKLNEMAMAASKEAMEPMTARMNAAAELAKGYAA